MMNQTVPYGTALLGGAVPGTSCQATIVPSLRDISARGSSQQRLPDNRQLTLTTPRTVPPELLATGSNQQSLPSNRQLTLTTPCDNSLQSWAENRPVGCRLQRWKESDAGCPDHQAPDFVRDTLIPARISGDVA